MGKSPVESLSPREQERLAEALAHWAARHQSYLRQQAQERAYRSFLKDPEHAPPADPPYYDESTRRGWDASPGQAATMYTLELEEALRTLDLLARSHGKTLALSMDNEDRLFNNGSVEARDGQSWYDLACERGFIR
jgi:hypothetical protein